MKYLNSIKVLVHMSADKPIKLICNLCDRSCQKWSITSPGFAQEKKKTTTFPSCSIKSSYSDTLDGWYSLKYI